MCVHDIVNQLQPAHTHAATCTWELGGWSNPGFFLSSQLDCYTCARAHRLTGLLSLS